MKTRLAIGCGIICIFLLGFAAGGLGSAIWFGKKVKEVAEGKSTFLEEMIAKRAKKRLGLDPAQVEDFNALIAEARDEIKPIQRGAGDEVKLILRDKYEPRLRAMLNEEQAAKWDQWLQEMIAKEREK